MVRTYWRPLNKKESTSSLGLLPLPPLHPLTTALQKSIYHFSRKIKITLMGTWLLKRQWVLHGSWTGSQLLLKGIKYSRFSSIKVIRSFTKICPRWMFPSGLKLQISNRTLVNSQPHHPHCGTNKSISHLDFCRSLTTGLGHPYQLPLRSVLQAAASVPRHKVMGSKLSRLPVAQIWPLLSAKL